MIPRWVRLSIGLLLLTLATVPAAQADTPLIQVSTTPTLGSVLADSTGMTLYWLEGEVNGTFHCVGKCLSFWPPLVLPAGMAAVTVGTGVTGTFGVITRPDTGDRQVTYNGYPLYRFAGDKAPGQTNGEGVQGPEGIWHAAKVTAATPLTIAAAQANVSGMSGWFTVSFASTVAGRGMVYFGSGPGCLGLVEVGSNDQTAGTTSHRVVVTGNDYAGPVGNNGVQPGVTYWYELVTLTSSGTQIDNNAGKCYSVTIPAASGAAPSGAATSASSTSSSSSTTTATPSPSYTPTPSSSGSSNPYP